jgi:rare lipoprotein A
VLPHARRGLIASIMGLLTLLAGCHHARPKSTTAYTAPALDDDEPNDRASKRPAPIVRPSAKHSTPAPASSTTLDAPEGRPAFTEIGLASWYGPPYHNHQAADGSVFDQNALTVAHRTLPMGTIVRVTNIATGDSIIAKVTDRGPFVEGRTLDLSLAAAKAIGVYRAGVAKVKIEAFPPPNADPDGKWCVQIGTDLTRRYASAKVIEFQGPTGFWVRINPIPADHTSATRIANSIHIPDAEPYLVRLN